MDMLNLFADARLFEGGTARVEDKNCFMAINDWLVLLIGQILVALFRVQNSSTSLEIGRLMAFGFSRWNNSIHKALL